MPNVVAPSRNLTVSPFEGVPAVELTVAVNVTASPQLEGFTDDESVVVLGALETTCVSTVDVLER